MIEISAILPLEPIGTVTLLPQSPGIDVQLIEPKPATASIGIQGPKGDTGPRGLTGNANAGGLTYYQVVASAEWHVQHNFGYRPGVTVVDSAGTVIIGSVTYDDVNNLTIRFAFAFGGSAYLI